MGRFEFLFDGEPVEGSIENSGGGYTVKVDGRELTVENAGPGRYVVSDGQSRIAVSAAMDGNICFVDAESVLMEFKEPSDDSFAGSAGDQAAEKDKIFAPMPGKIVKIMVEVGQEVDVKQGMVIVEAMKMENQVLSKAAGVVKAVNFKAGDQVDTETPIIELELPEE